MPVYGDLSTMSLADLLQWASANRKTGVLELERNKISRRIEFRKGWIAACSSDDPPSLLGQFLLSRGKLTEERLREALARQEVTRTNLGVILMEMGVLTQAELARQIAAKAEETIHGLFDWEDAVFRFHQGATLDPNQIEVRLSVNDVLLKGIQHHDELQTIRSMFTSSGIVLRRTGRAAPAELLAREMAHRIYDSIDGERTLAEILLHAHASEFLVLKLLFRLHKLGLVEIAQTRPVVSDSPTLLDVQARAGVSDLPWNEGEPDAAPAGAGASGDGQVKAAPELAASGGGLEVEIEVATRLISRGEHEAALELLNASYRAHPADSHLKRLITRAEAAYIQAVRGEELSPEKIPVLLPAEEGSDRQQLGPQESFLLSLIDGRSDIKTILWLTPLREVEALQALRKMHKRGLIELQRPKRLEQAGELSGAAFDQEEWSAT